MSNPRAPKLSNITDIIVMAISAMFDHFLAILRWIAQLVVAILNRWIALSSFRTTGAELN